MGLRTKVWGPPGWIFFHSVAFGYPMNPRSFNKKHKMNVQKVYKNFFTSLGWVFPCKYCRESYRKFIKEIPVDKYLCDRISLAYWSFLIHNKVNKKLGKQCLNDNQFLTMIAPRYESYRAKCSPTTDLEKRMKNSNKGCVIPAGNKYPLKCKISFEPDKEAAKASGFGKKRKKIQSRRLSKSLSIKKYPYYKGGLFYLNKKSRGRRITPRLIRKYPKVFSKKMKKAIGM